MSAEWIVWLSARRRMRSAGLGKRANGEETPVARNALEGGGAAVVELQPRAGHQVLDGLRDEHLPGGRLGRHPRPDRDRDAGDLLVDDLALAGVEPGAELEPQLGHRVPDRARAADRTRRPVEAGEEPVARRVQLDAAVAGQLASGPGGA